MIKYKVTCLQTNTIRRYPSEEDIVQHDVMVGWGYEKQAPDMFFDLWMTSDKNADANNYMSIGKVLAIDEYGYYKTKLGTFSVEKL